MRLLRLVFSWLGSLLYSAFGSKRNESRAAQHQPRPQPLTLSVHTPLVFATYLSAATAFVLIPLGTDVAMLV